MLGKSVAHEWPFLNTKRFSHAVTSCTWDTNG